MDPPRSVFFLPGIASFAGLVTATAWIFTARLLLLLYNHVFCPDFKWYSARVRWPFIENSRPDFHDLWLWFRGTFLAYPVWLLMKIFCYGMRYTGTAAVLRLIKKGQVWTFMFFFTTVINWRQAQEGFAKRYGRVREMSLDPLKIMSTTYWAQLKNTARILNFDLGRSVDDLFADQRRARGAKGAKTSGGTRKTTKASSKTEDSETISLSTPALIADAYARTNPQDFERLFSGPDNDPKILAKLLAQQRPGGGIVSSSAQKETSGGGPQHPPVPNRSRGGGVTLAKPLSNGAYYTPHRWICIPGIFENNHSDLYHNFGFLPTEVAVLRYETSRLLALSSAEAETKTVLAQIWQAYEVFNVFKFVLNPPAAAMTLVRYIQRRIRDPREIFVFRARFVGRSLAHFLYKTTDHPISLVGVSYGSYVLLFCLCELWKIQRVKELEERERGGDGDDDRGGNGGDNEEAARGTKPLIIQDVVFCGSPIRLHDIFDFYWTGEEVTAMYNVGRRTSMISRFLLDGGGSHGDVQCR